MPMQAYFTINSRKPYINKMKFFIKKQIDLSIIPASLVEHVLYE